MQLTMKGARSLIGTVMSQSTCGEVMSPFSRWQRSSSAARLRLKRACCKRYTATPRCAKPPCVQRLGRSCRGSTKQSSRAIPASQARLGLSCFRAAGSARIASHRGSAPQVAPISQLAIDAGTRPNTFHPHFPPLPRRPLPTGLTAKGRVQALPRRYDLPAASTIPPAGIPHRQRLGLPPYPC